MILYAQRRMTCAVCEFTRAYLVLLAAHSFGYSDLDMRPPARARWDILRTIHCCKSCRYCAPDLSECPPTAPATVKMRQYKALRRDRSVPKLARHWACWSMVQGRAANATGAGRAALHAAWVCDDVGKPLGAERFRSRAIDLFQEVQRSGGSFAGGHVTEQLLLVDLFRKVGRFENGLGLCRQLEAGEIAPELRPIVQFQRFLAEREDRRGYSTHDAEEYAEAPTEWAPSPPPAKGWFASLFARLG
jgi:hypothetical protein